MEADITLLFLFPEVYYLNFNNNPVLKKLTSGAPIVNKFKISTMCKNLKIIFKSNKTKLNKNKFYRNNSK